MPAAKLIFGSRYVGGILLRPISLFVGLSWVAAGEHKIRDAAWMSNGHALVNPDPQVQGFWERMAAIPERRPDRRLLRTSAGIEISSTT